MTRAIAPPPPRTARAAPPSDAAGSAARPHWPGALLPLLASAGLVTAMVALLGALPWNIHGPIGQLAALVSGVCAQRLAHSYTFAGVQLPFEARETGIFGGFLAGITVLATVGRARAGRLPRGFTALLLLAGGAAMVVDGFNALFFDLGLPTAYAPDLRLRLATGVLAGVTLAFAIVPAIAAPDTNPVAPGAPRPGVLEAALAWLAGGAYAFLLTSGWPPLLLPIALTSVGGVVLLLALANRVALDWPALRPLRAAVGIHDGWALAAASAALALAELGVLAAARALLLP